MNSEPTAKGEHLLDECREMAMKIREVFQPGTRSSDRNAVDDAELAAVSVLIHEFILAQLMEPVK